VRGGVVVSSGGAAFRDPRLFDRNKFTSLCTLVTTVPTERIPHPRAHPGRTAAPRQPATRPPAAPGADPDGHGAPPRIAAWRRALESLYAQTVQFRVSLVLLFAYFGSSLKVYKIYITRCS